MNDVMKMNKSLEESDPLKMAVSEAAKNKAKEQKTASRNFIRYFRCYFIRKSISR